MSSDAARSLAVSTVEQTVDSEASGPVADRQPQAPGEPVIRVRNLSKVYQIYDAPGDRLKQFLLPRLQRLIARAPTAHYREFAALHDVSFDIRAGETVGVVGRNGSGKSTLLQLICGTLTASGGHCEARGNIAALLELGTGFNPQFTGRENVFLYGQVLGLRPRQINELLPEIEAFADIGEFIDQPVKTYSSGMLMRLAFAVSVSRSPDVLIVDEALSVGDDAFQRKCFARLEDLRRLGTTILFVSHAAASVVELCDRALLLDSGELLFDGRPKETIALYNKLLFAAPARRPAIREEIRHTVTQAESDDELLRGTAAAESADNTLHDKPKAQLVDTLVAQTRLEYEPRGAVILDPHIETVDGNRVNVLVPMEEYQYCYRVRFERSARHIQFGMLIKAINGLELAGAMHPGVVRYLDDVVAGAEYQVAFAFRCLVNPGSYFFNAGVQGIPEGEADPTYMHRIIDAVMFRVQPDTVPVSTAHVNLDISSISTRVAGDP